MQDDKITESVQNWMETFVIELNLCPFAKRELVNNRVWFTVTDAKTEDQLLKSLQAELERLNNNASIETTLLIHPQVLQDFYEYNQFLSIADSLLLDLNLEGIYQIASFHPDYQFGGTNPDDLENYTNRSPFPMLHLLREDSIEKAIDKYPDVDQIPARNIELMKSIGRDKLNLALENYLVK